MLNEKSPRGSGAEFDYHRAVDKSESRYLPKFLQLNKFFNRPAASLIVRALYRTRVTPNQVTSMAFLLGLLGAYGYFQGRRSWFIVGAILTQLSSIVDCADGMLARARGQVSEFGAALDLLFDRVNEFFLMTGYAYGFYRQTGRQDVFVLGLVGCGLYFLQTSVYYLLRPYYGQSSRGETAEIRAWLLFLSAVFAVVDRMDWGIYILLAATLSINSFHIVRFLRSRRA